MTNAQMINELVSEWEVWCDSQDLVLVDAEEALIVFDELTKYQRIYISSFIVRWDDAMKIV